MSSCPKPNLPSSASSGARCHHQILLKLVILGSWPRCSLFALFFATSGHIAGSERLIFVEKSILTRNVAHIMKITLFDEPFRKNAVNIRRNNTVLGYLFSASEWAYTLLSVLASLERFRSLSQKKKRYGNKVCDVNDFPSPTTAKCYQSVYSSSSVVISSKLLSETRQRFTLFRLPAL